MKKVLSFVLVLSLVLSSFSMAFAGETKTTGLSDIAGVANEEAINVVNDLGIVTGYTDGTFKADKAVNRAEFAVMITKALGIPESALAGYTATNFTDVAGYEWAVPYLAFCESKGIMSGYGEGIVKPGNTITVNEAMTMALRAIGYTPNSTVLVGTWPANYVTLAQDNDLYEDVKAVATVDRGSAAQIIYNSLTVRKVQVAADGTTTPINQGTVALPVYATMLTDGLDCTKFDGVIGDSIANESIINIQKYMGLYGTAYLNDDQEIVAFISDSEYVAGDWTVDGTYHLGGYMDADKEYRFANSAKFGPAEDDVTLTAATNVPAFLNGEAVPTSTSLGAYTVDTTLTFAVKVAGKTFTELHSIIGWIVDDAMMVEEGDIDDLEDQGFAGYEFVLDSEDEIDYNSFELVGASSLEAIEEDDVVYIFLGADNKTIRKIAVGTEVVEGKITDYDADDAVWTINGKDYELTTKHATGTLDGLAATSVGDTFKLYLDAFGDIYAAEEIESTPDTYGVVTYFAPEGIDSAKVKMFTSEGTTKTFEVDEDAVTELGNLFSTAAATTVSRVLVGYSVDKDGVIDAIDYSVTPASVGSTVGSKIFTITDSGISYDILKDTVVFTWDGTDLELAKMGDLESTLAYAATAIVNGDNELLALLVDARDANATADDVYGVFHKVTSTHDTGLDATVDKIVGIAGTEAFTKNADTSGLANATVVTGAAYKIEYDSEGYITAVNPITNGGNSGKWAIHGTWGTTTIGALSQNNTVITLSGGSTYELADDVIVYYYDADDKEYSVSKASSLKKEYKVVLYNTDADDNKAIDIVIYTK